MNQLSDCHGLATTTSSRKAMDIYDKAVHQMQCHRGDPVETIDEALIEDPNFVMGHCLRAYTCTTMADAAGSEQLSRCLANAREAAENFANDRERLHISALETWLQGDISGLSDRLNDILIRYPVDYVALQKGHITDFHLGAAASLRDRVARVLPQYDFDMPGYGYALGMYAFGLEECNEYQKAEQIGRRAVEANSDDVWAIHAVAHVKEMQGHLQEGVEWYSSCEQDWSEDNNFAIHNWWHLALFHLNLHNIDKVFEIYDQFIAKGSFALEFIDATALLWRLHLAQIDVGNRWDDVADKWEESLSNTDFYCFNDYHALASFIAAERWHSARNIVERMKSEIRMNRFSAEIIQQIGFPIITGLMDFAQERYEDAVANLSKVRYRNHRFGGSHAQRDLLAYTLIEAAVRAGQHRYARGLLAERTATKASCTLTQRNIERLVKDGWNIQ